MKRYGVPYQGSKNAIAKRIIDFIPPANNFYDLFAGGYAITHCAIESGKWQNFVANDIDGAGIELFVNAVSGKYKNEKRWIGREDFLQLKNTDPYVQACWSFGNNRRNYLYSKEIEPWKKALHYARVFGDASLLSEFGINSNGSRADIKAYCEEYKQKYIAWYTNKAGHSDNLQSLEKLQKLQRLQSLESLERLESLQSLESLESLQSLERFTLDYQAIRIKPNSVIYCDIPYRQKTGYGQKFDYDRFYKWACEQTQPIFISEYWMPEDKFKCVLEIPHLNRMDKAKNTKSIERLFMPR